MPARAEALQTSVTTEIPDVPLLAWQLHTPGGEQILQRIMTTPSAPCPDESTAGVHRAIKPTASPPHAGRSQLGTPLLRNSSSVSVTPRMMAMPTRAQTMARGRTRWDTFQRIDAQGDLWYQIEWRCTQRVHDRDSHDRGDCDGGEGAGERCRSPIQMHRRHQLGEC